MGGDDNKKGLLGLNAYRQGEELVLKKLFSIIAIVSLVISVPALPLAQAATFTVTTNADSGVGSLRQAIADVNTSTGTNTIAFAGAIGTINLLSALPFILIFLSPGSACLVV